MGENLRLIRAIPGPSSLQALVEHFAKGGEGSVSALDDAMLPVLHALVGEDDDIKVLPFGTLVRQALQEVGEEVLQLATNDQMAAALGRSATRLRDESELRRVVRFPGMRKALVRALRELEEWGYDLDFLAEHTEGALADTLRDLRDLRAGALELLKEIGRDTHIHQIRTCLESISDPETRPSRILAFIGAEAPPAKLDWLKWAAGRGSEITVVVDRHATDGQLFSIGQGVAAKLGCPTADTGSGNRLLNNLFAQTTQRGVDVKVGVESAADPLAECEWALRQCLQPEGHQAAIYVRSLASYAPLLKASAERLGVSLKIQSRAPLLENAFARFSLEILEACAGNDVRLFLPVVRSSYLALSGGQRSRLQAALRDAKARKNRQWEELATWLGNAEDAPKWLLEVLRWREAVMKAPGTLRAWHQQLRELVGSFLQEESLRWSPGYDPQRDTRAFNAMHIALENEAVLGASGREQVLSLAEFVRRCRTVWEAADVSLPAGEGIPVVSTAAGLGQADEVFVLGMLEGVFPRRRSEEPILSDEDREKISRLMPECAPLQTSRDIAAAERDEFYRVCAAAKHSITFSYPETGEDRDNIPAFYLEVVKQAMGGEDKVASEVHARVQLAPNADLCVAAADRELREALDSPRQESPSCELTSVVASREVHPTDSEAFRPSGLRDALQCPFRYQMRDRLKIATRSRLSHWSRLRNLPQAAGLVKTADVEEARRLLELALESELDLILSEAPDWELRLLRAGGNRLISDWLQREFRAREIWPREIEAVDVRIGEHGIRDTVSGNRKLEGKVPAVSHLRAGAKLIHLYTMQPKEEEVLTDPERLYVGLYFGMGFETGREVALELEGSAGRTLLVLTRAGIGSLRADVRGGLKVTDLSTTDDPVESKNAFGRETKRLLKEALQLIDRGEILPRAGSHCDYCDFGELCRRSAQFSDDDSPFGEDEAIGAA